MPEPKKSPRIFISYAHDSDDHKARVLALADRLRSEGLDAWIDRYRENDPGDWPRWMREEIEKADFVLCVASPVYIKRFDGKEDEGKGLGSKWEGAIIYQSLYEAQGKDAKFIAIAFSRDEAEKCIPLILRGPTRYVLEDERAYEDLYRRVTGQPRVVAPPIGEIRILQQEVPTDTAAEPPKEKVIRPQQTARSTAVTEAALSGKHRGLAAKLGLLDHAEQVYVLSELRARSSQPLALEALGIIATEPPKELDVAKLATAIMKDVVLSGDVNAYVIFMRSWPADVIALADPSVRVAFFAEVIAMMNADQYEDVNRITPAVVEIQSAIPAQQHAEFMAALFEQGDSGAYTGAPAALRALKSMPQELATTGIAILTPEMLIWKPHSKACATFLAAHQPLWPADKTELFLDFLNLDEAEFHIKYSPF